MGVVLYLYVCPFISKNMESCTFMKLQCILCILCILCKLCYIMLFGVNLHWSFDFGENILTTYQNLPKSVFLFIYMG